MKRSYIQDPITHKLVPKEEYYQQQEHAHIVMNDIEPYQSMITGEMITSRSKHRQHLREHRCIELGNEKPTPKQDISLNTSRKEILKAQLGSMRQSEISAAVRHDVENMKWNSRKN